MWTLRRLAAVLTLAALLTGSGAYGQGLPLWPQTLPANTVIGRLGAGQAGPAEAIPFVTLSSQLNSIGYGNQTANYIFAGPSTGSASTPTFRALVGADLPVPTGSTLGGVESISCSTNGWISSISGSGVPSCATVTAAAILPTPTRAGDVLYWNGSAWVTIAGNNSSTQYLSENSSGVPAWGSPSGAGTVTSIDIINGNNAAITGTCNSTSSVSCTLTVVTPPQGRLTLQSGTPVMNTNKSAVQVIYYDCYKGGKYAPVYNGGIDVMLAIGSCEVSDTMPTSSTGVTNNAGVFDEWAVDVGNALVICHATNGSGGGWASDTAGSNTARGSGYSQLDLSTRPYITNANSIAHCYNGSTDEGSIGANNATYLGTFFTTAAGKTSMVFTGSASGGNSNVLGLFNAYNQVNVFSQNIDSITDYTYGSATWRQIGGNTGDVVTIVDGLGEVNVHADFQEICNTGPLTGCVFGIAEDWSSGAPTYVGTLFGPQITSCSGCGVQETSANVLVGGDFVPSIGKHTIYAIESNYNTSANSYYGSAFFNTTLQAIVLTVHLRM